MPRIDLVEAALNKALEQIKILEGFCADVNGRLGDLEREVEQLKQTKTTKANSKS